MLKKSLFSSINIRNISHYYFIVLILGLFWINSAYPSYKAILVDSLRNNFNIESSELQTKASATAISKTKRNYMPQINFNSSLGMTNNKIAKDERFTTFELSASQLIYSPTINGGIALEKQKWSAQSKQENATIHKFIYELNSSLIRLKESEERVTIYHSNYKNIQAHLKATRKRFKIGELTKTDVWQSESRLHSTLAELKEAKDQYDANVKEVQKLTSLETVPKFDFPTLTPYTKKLSAMEATNRIKNNPELNLLEKRIDLIRSEIELTKARHLPTIQLTANHIETNHIDNNYQNETETSVALQIQIPIFSGRRDSLATVEKHYQRLASQKILQYKEHTTKTEISKIQQSIIKNQEILSIYEKALLMSKKAQYGIEKEFKSGTKSNIDVLNAQSDLIENMKNIVKIKYSIIQKQFDLLYQLGALSSSFVERLK